MTCPDRTEALNALIDNELDRPGRAALRAHLEACPACAGALVELLSLRAELASLAPPEPAPPALAARIAEALARESPAAVWHATAAAPPPRAPSRRRGLSGFGLGVLSAGLVAAGLFLTLSAPVPSHERLTLAALADAAARTALPEPGRGLSRAALAAWFRHQDVPAPALPQLAAAGFRLDGYGTDLVFGHRAARVRYAGSGGVVLVFAWTPGPGEGAHPPRTARAGTWTVTYWNDGHTEFWVVGADAAATHRFVTAYRADL